MEGLKLCEKAQHILQEQEDSSAITEMARIVVREGREVIKKHGADKILFATDSPWNEQKAYLEHFKTLSGITDNEKEMILHRNAEKLLL